MHPIGKAAKKVSSFVFVVVASTVAGHLLMKWENGAFTIWPRDLVKDTLEQLVKVDPMTHAVLSDHMDEARAIVEAAHQTNDWNTGRKNIQAMAKTYVVPALSKSDDSFAIAAAEKSLDLIEVLSFHYQQGCVRFADGSLSSADFSLPQVDEAYRIYSEALRAAYINGKSNNAVNMLPIDQAGLIAIETLGLTEKDAEALQNPAGAEPRQLCEAFKKIYNIKLVPPSQKGAYARTIIAGG